MGHKKISVVLPFHNAQAFLAEAIRSVLDSSFTDFELLLIDDGSTDLGPAIAERRAETDARIRLISQPHGGIVAALNRGLAEAQADVVARMDSDDICAAERLGRQYEFLRAHPHVALVSCLVEPIFGRRPSAGILKYVQWLNESLSPEKIRRDLFIESPLPHPSVMFRREAVTALGGYRDYDGPEDYDLWLRMSAERMLFAKVPEILLGWRFHRDNLSNRDTRYRKNAFLQRKLAHVAACVSTGMIAAGRERIRICGPGQAGKKLFRSLADAGRTVEAFVDVNPRRAVPLCQGVQVLGTGAIGERDSDCFYFCAIRRWDAWEQIRELFSERGKMEGEDYLIM